MPSQLDRPVPTLAGLAAGGQQVLATFKRALEELGVELPERQYVAPAQAIVWDGEQFTVNLAGATQGQPGGLGATGTPMPPQSRVFVAQWAINIVRSVTALNTTTDELLEMIPSEPTIEADGLQSISDGAALLQAAQGIHERYELSKSGHGFMINGLQPLGPEGGLAAQRLLVTISLG